MKLDEKTHVSMEYLFLDIVKDVFATLEVKTCETPCIESVVGNNNKLIAKIYSCDKDIFHLRFMEVNQQIFK